MYSIDIKCSKSRRFLGLHLRSHLGSVRRSPRPSSHWGLLAYGNRSFAPSALAISPTRLYPWLKRPRLDYTREYYGLGQFIPRGILLALLSLHFITAAHFDLSIPLLYTTTR